MIKYGYYLTLGPQLAETQDHVNLLWLDDRRLSPEDLANATMLGKTCVIDVAGCIFDGRTIRPDATERLQALRTYIKLHGLLSAVEVLVPCDEPNLPETDVAHLLPAAVRLMRDAWPEARIGCIYYNDGVFPEHHLFDVLGFDDYDGGFGIFQPPRWWEHIKLWLGKLVRRGSYLRFAELLRPDQRTWLIPGGTYGERPGPWLTFAQDRPEVWAIVPFLWASNVDGQHDLVGIRARDDVRESYRLAGLACMNAFGVDA